MVTPHSLYGEARFLAGQSHWPLRPSSPSQEPWTPACLVCCNPLLRTWAPDLDVYIQTWIRLIWAFVFLFKYYFILKISAGLYLGWFHWATHRQTEQVLSQESWDKCPPDMSPTAKKEGFHFTVHLLLFVQSDWSFSLDLVDVLGSGQVNVQSKLTRGIQRLAERALLSRFS